MLVLKDGDKVAVTYNSYTPLFKVLYICGIMHLSPYDGLVPEWNQAGERLMGKEGAQGFANMVNGMLKAGVFEMVRMAVKPTWVGILDFGIRFSSGIEKGVKAMASVM